jgi:hypothetical protein
MSVLLFLIILINFNFLGWVNMYGKRKTCSFNAFCLYILVGPMYVSFDTCMSV